MRFDENERKNNFSVMRYFKYRDDVYGKNSRIFGEFKDKKLL